MTSWGGGDFYSSRRSEKYEKDLPALGSIPIGVGALLIGSSAHALEAPEQRETQGPAVLEFSASQPLKPMISERTPAFHLDPEEDLGAALSSVEDDQGTSALTGSLSSLDEASFTTDDSTGTEIKIDETGSVSFSADGNPGFSISFEDVSGPLEGEKSGELLSFEAGDDASIVPQFVDRHFRGLYVLDSPESPDEFSISVSGASGAVLSLADDGGILIRDAMGEEIGGLLAPWAKDSANKPVPTHFVVVGQEVRQVVDTSRLREADFPVVADPATYINAVKRTVVNVNNHGSVAKWKKLNACTSTSRLKGCDIGKTYGVTASVQGALDLSAASVGSSLGITVGETQSVSVTCKLAKGPGTVTLYAGANKTTYQVKRVQTSGVAPKLKTKTTMSGVLTAYKPNGRYVCS